MISVEELYSYIGRRIAALRVELPNGTKRLNPLTQSELSSLSTISRSTIASIESGRQQAAIHHLYLFAQALGINVHEFLPPDDFIKFLNRDIDIEGDGAEFIEPSIVALIDAQFKARDGGNDGAQ